MKENTHVSTHYEDEVSLIDLWRVVTKRKWLILITVIVFMSIASGYIFSQKRVYGVTAQIALARITVTNDTGTSSLYAVDPDVLTKQFAGQALKAGGHKLAWVSSVEITKPTILDIKVEGYTKKDTVHFMTTLTNELIATQNKVVLARKQQLTEYAVTLAHQLDMLRQTEREKGPGISPMGQKIGVGSGEKSYGLEKINTILRLQTAIENAKTQASDLYLRQAQSIQPSSAVASLVKPKTKSIYMLTLFLSVIIGVFVAFFAEFISSVKAQTQVQNS